MNIRKAICIIQTNSLRPTCYLYLNETSRTFHLLTDFQAPELVWVGGHSYVIDEAEFEDPNLDLDMDVHYQKVDENPEGNLCILCWLALESSKEGMLVWRAPCYLEMEQLDSAPLAECYLWVSRQGELTVSVADGEVAYTSNRTVSGVQQMVLSEENDVLLLNEDLKAVWSSRGNKVFNCVD